MSQDELEQIKQQVISKKKLAGWQVDWLISEIDSLRENGGYSEQWIDCHKCGLSINPHTILCVSCSIK